MSVGPETPDITLDARFDRNLAWWRGGSYRYLVVELAARAAEDDRAHRPHHLAIAIDASAGMRGLALSAAKQLARGLVQRLGASDTVAIVSFAGTARTELAPVRADASGKRQAEAAIARIETRAGCDFTDGWLAAAEHAAARIEKEPGDLAKIVVISRGRADRGLRHAEDVARHASELRARGISTVSVAVGRDCDLSLLIAIDDPDGLNQGFAAAQGEDAVRVLVSNRFALAPRVARDARLALSIPAGAKISVMGGVSCETSGQRVVCTLGDIHAGARRFVVFVVRLDRGEVGATAEFVIEADWTDEGGKPRHIGPIAKTLAFARGRDNTPQMRDMPATLTVVAQWRLKLLRDLISLNRQNRLREAEDLLASQLKYLERYAHGIPEAVPLLDELRVALPMVHRPWRERHAPASAPLP